MTSNELPEFMIVDEKTAKEFATGIENFSENLTHLPLTWDGKKEGFGIKYNLLFDKVLDLNLFSRNLREKETDFYIEKSLPFGMPFFDIKNYVKSDWAIWVAALTDDPEKRKKRNFAVPCNNAYNIGFLSRNGFAFINKRRVPVHIYECGQNNAGVYKVR